MPAYAYDTSTGKWVATNQPSFYWNGSLWVSPYYTYDAQNGWYYVNHSAAPLTGATGYAAGPAAGDATVTGTSLDATKAKLAALLGISDPAISNTGFNSTNTATLNNNANALLTILALAAITNNQTSNATSGNATVSGNTQAQDATTGMANVVSNFLNLINSAWGWGSGTLSYFVDNIFGNHTGDITLAPQTVGSGGGGIGCYFCFGGTLDSNTNTGANSTNTATTNANKDLTVDYRPTGTIDNNIDLLAQSGNAGVTGNTVGGSAKSGDANAELNLINMINSAIGSGGSFFGLINIFGDLNGDILFPKGFVDSLLGGSGGLGSGGGSATASNTGTGPNSNNTATTSSNSNATITDNSQSTFNNNINAAAQSGAADVSNNTKAGGATTGDSKTNTNTYNLFNSGVVGDNAVLVLVNVLGHWVGLVMGLPSGGGSSQSALLGGNATVTNANTGPNSNNTASSSTNSNLNVNYAPNSTINNNVRAGAISGDATVSGNTAAGGAASGDAGVATNVVNILGSNLSLTHWFGILVVNVFGDWFGSVGVNTPAGNAPAASAGVGGGSLPGGKGESYGQPTTGLYQGNSSGGVTQVAGTSSGHSSNLGSVTVASANNIAKFAESQKAASQAGLLFVAMAILLLTAGGLMGAERKFRKS